MSSTEHAFVKAFSRRNRGESPTMQPAQTVAPQAAPEVVANSENERASAATDGEIEVDPRLASTVSLWNDPAENGAARADVADPAVPAPHLASHDAAEAVDAAALLDQHFGDSTQIHTAYASGTLAQDWADVTDSDTLSAPAEPAPAAPVVETRIDPPQNPLVDRPPAKTDVEAPTDASAEPDTSAAETAGIESSQAFTQADAAPSESETAEFDTPENDASAFDPTAVETSALSPAEARVAELEAYMAQLQSSVEALDASAAEEASVDSVAEAAVGPEQVATPAVDTTFRAAWEVDVFDVPGTVADLFFEGPLFRQIAERMLDAVGSGLSSMLITSAHHGAGRSSVALGMAMAAAASGIRVALVDGDAEKPTLADCLRLDLQHGWVDSIRGGLPLKEAAVHAVEDGLTLVPLIPPAGAADAATGRELGQLAEQLQSKFDLVIVDGPCGQSTSITESSRHFDSVVIVHDRRRADDSEIAELTERLEAVGIRGIGLVENFD